MQSVIYLPENYGYVKDLERLAPGGKTFITFYPWKMLQASDAASIRCYYSIRIHVIVIEKNEHIYF